MKRSTLKKMVTSSALSALAVILTWLEIQIGPSGGSINFVMLPIILVAWQYGLGWGIGSGLVVGFIMSVIVRLVSGVETAEISIDMGGIFMGIIVLCVTRFFVHGAELEKDVDGLL